ncbi:MAG: hypothetical protein RL538_844 [Candidatus Parcubacteria bacterium]|jgi:Leucine-rich repeat (LRR) protein
MNFTFVISLLILFAAGLWWFGQGFESVKEDSGGDTDTGVYQDALDSAQEVTEKVADKTEAVVSEVGGAKVTVYDGISVPAGTKVLDVSGRGLTGSLKAEVRHLTELTSLNMSNNKLTGIPAEVGQLSKLEVLNLSNNPFTGLPYELGNLKNLKILDLRGTQYAKQDLEIIKKSLPASTQILVD